MLSRAGAFISNFQLLTISQVYGTTDYHTIRKHLTLGERPCLNGPLALTGQGANIATSGAVGNPHLIDVKKVRVR